MQRREMTADEGETLVVHFRKALQGQHMVQSCPFMSLPSTSHNDAWNPDRSFGDPLFWNGMPSLSVHIEGNIVLALISPLKRASLVFLLRVQAPHIGFASHLASDLLPLPHLIIYRLAIVPGKVVVLKNTAFALLLHIFFIGISSVAELK